MTWRIFTPVSSSLRMRELRADWESYADRLEMYERMRAFAPAAFHPIDGTYAPDGHRWLG